MLIIFINIINNVWVIVRDYYEMMLILPKRNLQLISGHVSKFMGLVGLGWALVIYICTYIVVHILNKLVVYMQCYVCKLH